MLTLTSTIFTDHRSRCGQWSRGRAAGVHESDLVDLVARTTVEPGDLPAGRGRIAGAVRRGPTTRDGGTQVRGEAYGEGPGVPVIAALAEIREDRVLPRAERQRLGCTTGPAVGQPGAVRQGQAHLVDPRTGPQVKRGRVGGDTVDV